MPGSQVTESPLADQPKLERRKNGQGFIYIPGLRRGMIYWGEVGADSSKESEHYHPAERPCPWLIISAPIVHARLPVAVVLPLSSKVDNGKDDPFRLYRVRINAKDVTRYRTVQGDAGLSFIDRLALSEQIRVFAHARFIGEGPIGYVGTEVMGCIEAGVKEALDFA